MANTFKFGNGEWAVGKETALAYNDENSNFKPLPFTFDRASTATVVNKDGLIETVGTDEPRIDFLNNTKGHLLLEPSRTNSILYSNGFDDSTWQKGLGGTASAPVVSANQGTSPDGSNNAYKVDFDLGGGTTSTDRSRLTQSVTGTSSTEYVFTFYAKAYSTSDVGKIVNFSVDNVSDEDSNFTLTSEWQRFTFSGTSTGTTINQHIQLRGNLSTSDSVSMLLFGYQMEAGSYATSYIPTSGQSGGVTRSAEICKQENLPSASIPNSYPFTVFCNFEIVESVKGFGFSFLNIASSTEYFSLGYREDGVNNKFRFTNRISSIYSAETSSTYGSGFYKVAVVFSQTNIKAYINGSEVIDYDHSSASLFPNVNDLLLGQLRIVSDTGSRNNVKDLRLYNTALSNSELQALTS
jgi:hypothetical protein